MNEADTRLTVKTHRDPVEVIFPDGRRVFSLHDSRSDDDWRDIKGIGRCNFGRYEIFNRRTIVEYPDGRQEATTLEAQGMIEIYRERREREKSRGFFERLVRWMFG